MRWASIALRSWNRCAPDTAVRRGEAKAWSAGKPAVHPRDAVVAWLQGRARWFGCRDEGEYPVCDGACRRLQWTAWSSWFLDVTRMSRSSGVETRPRYSLSPDGEGHWRKAGCATSSTTRCHGSSSAKSRVSPRNTDRHSVAEAGAFPGPRGVLRLRRVARGRHARRGAGAGEGPGRPTRGRPPSLRRRRAARVPRWCRPRSGVDSSGSTSRLSMLRVVGHRLNPRVAVLGDRRGNGGRRRAVRGPPGSGRPRRP